MINSEYYWVKIFNTWHIGFYLNDSFLICTIGKWYYENEIEEIGKRIEKPS